MPRHQPARDLYAKPQAPRGCAWGCLILGGILAILGLLTVAAIPLSWKRSQEIWTETPGTLTKSFLEEGYRKTQRKRTVSRRPVYDVRLEYSYRVENEQFTGGARAPRQPENDEDRDESKRIAESYRVGDALPVFHHPSNPSRSRLTAKEPRKEFWFDLLFGLLYLGGSGIAIAIARWMSVRNRPISSTS